MWSNSLAWVGISIEAIGWRLHRGRRKCGRSRRSVFDSTTDGRLMMNGSRYDRRHGRWRTSDRIRRSWCTLEPMLMRWIFQFKHRWFHVFKVIVAVMTGWWRWADAGWIRWSAMMRTANQWGGGGGGGGGGRSVSRQKVAVSAVDAHMTVEIAGLWESGI